MTRPPEIIDGVFWRYWCLKYEDYLQTIYGICEAASNPECVDPQRIMRLIEDALEDKHEA